MKPQNIVGVALSLALVIGFPTRAATLNWTLYDVVFDDGGTAGGTFSTDSDSGGVTAFNIITTSGYSLAGASYNASTSFLYANNLYSPNSFLLATNGGSNNPYINLSFVNPLTSGGVNPLNLGGQLAGSWECANCNPNRNIISGYATTVAVPEPESWALMLIGFGGLGAALRMQRLTKNVIAA